MAEIDDLRAEVEKLNIALNIVALREIRQAADLQHARNIIALKAEEIALLKRDRAVTRRERNVALAELAREPATSTEEKP